MALMAWKYMGGQIDWAALPFLAEMLGVSDEEMLVEQLVLLRDELRGENAAQ